MTASLKYEPMVYIEGVLVPVQSIRIQQAIGRPIEIQIRMIPHPLFITSYSVEDATDEGAEAPEEESEEEGGEEATPPETPSNPVEEGDGTTHPNGLAYRCRINASGIQPRSIVQIFVYDVKHDEEIFLCEGRINSMAYVLSTMHGAHLEVMAVGNLDILQEVQMYMAELSRSLNLESGFTSSREGTATASSIINTLKDKGLDEGCRELIKKACTGACDYLNLIWRLYNYDNKFSVVKNPEATGYYSQTTLSKVLNKSIGEIPNRHPIVQLIQHVLSLVAYQLVENVAPNFINYDYSTAEQENVSKMKLEYTPPLKTNAIMILPEMMFSPPPRCNVIFPCQFHGYNFADDFAAKPTRGQARLGTTAVLDEMDSGTRTIIYPDSVKEGINEHGQYWSSSEEMYRGQILYALNANNPEYMKEMSSDYVDAFMKLNLEKAKYQSNRLTIYDLAFNPNLLLGMPSLILNKDGNHILAYLASVSHDLSPETGASTSVQFAFPRKYTEPYPKNSIGNWYRPQFFDQEHIGTRVYPQILGNCYAQSLTEDTATFLADQINNVTIFANTAINTFLSNISGDPVEEQEEEEEEEASGDSTEEEPVDNAMDLSILAILGGATMTVEQIKEAKSADTAIQSATNLIWTEYNLQPNKEEYAYAFGRRPPIGRKQLFRDFYHAIVSSDLFSATGGFTAETNSVSVWQGDPTSADSTTEEEQKELGQPISEDAIIAGCFYREKQLAILTAANTAMSMVEGAIAMDISAFLGKNIYAIGPDPEEIRPPKSITEPDPEGVTPDGTNNSE